MTLVIYPEVAIVCAPLPTFLYVCRCPKSFPSYAVGEQKKLFDSLCNLKLFPFLSIAGNGQGEMNRNGIERRERGGI